MIGFSYRSAKIFCIGLLVFSLGFPAVVSFRVGGNTNAPLSPICRRHGRAKFTPSGAPLQYSQMQSQLEAIRIREWREDDVEQIKSLLSSSDFDPEGPLEVDCGSAAAIQESYSINDGGCFLVATEDFNNDQILGTAALIVGTQVAYLKSGASISAAAVSGAVRRVSTTLENESSVSNKSIVTTLLSEIESRAAQAGATELILLAYPSLTNQRPNAELLEGMGYKQLPAKLQVPGVDAVQYAKVLGSVSGKAIGVDTGSSNDNNAVGDAAVGVVLVTALLVAFGFVANLMGLEVLPSVDNRGIGSPLSIQEVQRLKQDEQLKRTNLDGDEQTRQWEDWGNEERREEAALMRIIQGQDIRLQ